MKSFLKTLIGGALGLGALYVVGKVCYEAGKDVAEVERQLELGKPPEANEVECSEEHAPDTDKPDDVGSSLSPERQEYWRRTKEELHKVFDDARKQMAENESKETPDRKNLVGKFTDKIRNAKMFIRVKKAFEKKGERSPGILGSLLSNPDGARIEAFVRNGGVQINVTPRAA